MRRRDFLLNCAGGAAGAAALGSTVLKALAEPLNPQGGFLLSTTGCSAATAHPAANKIVTVENKTHVGWIDSDDEGQRGHVAVDLRANRRRPPGAACSGTC